MDMSGEIHTGEVLHTAGVLFDQKSDSHTHHHPPTLQEIQRRACEIHHEHGAVSGGYSLDEWLEAEHELDDEDDSDAGSGRVH